MAKKSKFIKNFNSILKNIFNFILTIISFGIYYIIKYLIPFQVASMIGGVLGKTLVYYFPFQRRKEVLKNIQLCFPEKTKQECLKIYKESCGNFVKVVFEMSKMEALVNTKNALEYVDKNNVLESLGKKKHLFIFAHQSNWLLSFAPIVFYENGYSIYKKPSNTPINTLMQKAMLNNDGKKYKHHTINLNRDKVLFLRQKLKKENAVVAMAIDQRIKEGLSDVTFFGRKAVTSHFIPILSRKCNVPITPIKIIRNSLWKKPYFTFVVEDPLVINAVADEKENILLLTQAMNDKVEEWVRSKPEQWFWLHRRW